MKILLILGIISAGVVIEQRPVITVTMLPPHTYTLWEKDSLDDEWVTVPMFSNFVCTATNRVVLEKGINADTGYFWLQIDGEPFPTNSTKKTTTSIPTVPSG